ncbi:hypothetical protein LTR95_003254 [Oleoguttula sp. CCFEE 5521]
MDAFTPQQTMELLSRVGQKKSKMRLDKLWWNSFLAGPLLGFGYAFRTMTYTPLDPGPDRQLDAPSHSPRTPLHGTKRTPPGSFEQSPPASSRWALYLSF